MRPTIRGSDVFVKEDLRAIIDSLDIAARHQPSGCWRDGWLAATNAVRTAIGIDVEQPEIVTVHEITEYRHERIEQRRPAPPAAPAPRFVIRGEREEWPAVPDRYQAGPELALTDCGYYDFVPGSGEVRRMEAGWMWLGNDGGKTFFPVQQWVELSAPEARSLGFLVAENRRFVLVLRSLFDERRRQLTSNDRRLLR